MHRTFYLIETEKPDDIIVLSEYKVTEKGVGTYAITITYYKPSDCPIAQPSTFSGKALFVWKEMLQ